MVFSEKRFVSLRVEIHNLYVFIIFSENQLIICEKEIKPEDPTVRVPFAKGLSTFITQTLLSDEDEGNFTLVEGATNHFIVVIIANTHLLVRH